MPTLKAMFKLFDGYSATINKIASGTDKASVAVLGASKNTDTYNQSLRNTGAVANVASSGLMRLVGAVISLAAVKKSMDLTDAYTNTNARLAMITDNLEEQKALQEAIFAAADRSRGSYVEMANATAKMKMLAGVGPALTIKARSGDNLALHAAIDMAQEGDVLVVSNEGDNTRALMGEIMMALLYHTKKAAGIILDGPIRDIDEIGKWDFPVYATGTTPGGPYKEGPGEVNVPISCGEISVNPGDIILADPDGIIVIPRKDAPQILEDAKKFQAADETKLAAAKNGTSKREWVKKSLEAKGFEFIDDAYEA